MEKRTLCAKDLDAQTALELPDRHMMALINVVITNVLNGLSVNVNVTNINVAVQICALVTALDTILTASRLTCTIKS